MIALPAGFAGHCTNWSTTPATAVAGHYVTYDVCQPSCLASIWVYEESNGRSGLQRDDGYVDNTCHGMIYPDTIVV